MVAFLDANVLWGAPTTDLLMNLAAMKVIDPKWSADVLREVRRTVLAARPNVSIDRRIAAMAAAAPSASVVGYRRLVPTMPAHPGDQHVLAAAVHCSADALVTNNLKHFHPERAAISIHVLSLDHFSRALLRRDPDSVMDALETMVAAHRRPPRTLLAFVELAATKLHLPGFAADLNQRLPRGERSMNPRLAGQRPLSAAGRAIAGLPAVRANPRAGVGRRNDGRGSQAER